MAVVEADNSIFVLFVRNALFRPWQMPVMDFSGTKCKKRQSKYKVNGICNSLECGVLEPERKH